ncbi:MAG: hypothetical protein KKD18_04865 [Nanoarchaeota archaeon]|nr:hypothetical protein [Nanoarchaeota archaeon]
MTTSKIFALLFTALVITLLVLSGPVQGFTLDLSANKVKTDKGDTVTFTAQIQIDQTEHLPIDKLILELSGPEKITCAFDKAGSPLDSCDNIKVSKIQDPGFSYGYDYNFGYGYGFASGILKYKIEIDTKNLKLGTYTPLFKVKIGEEYFSQIGQDIKIIDGDNDKETCGLEWSCTSWSECSGGVQSRECYRNLNYCELSPRPETERLCLLEDGNNFDDSVTLNTINPSTINSDNMSSLSLVSDKLNDGIRFIIILLLMNCIITTSNIIVKVQENRNIKSKKRKFPKMPSIKKAK